MIKNLMCLFILLLGIVSCNEDISTSTINEDELKPEISFGTMPDSVCVETSVDFDFMVEGKDESYELTLDTILPTYYNDAWIDYDKIPEGVAQVPEEAIIKMIKRGVTIEINENPLVYKMPIQKGRKYNVCFSAPQAVGDYSLVFKITGSAGYEYSQTIKIHVYSPAVQINVYNVDPWLDLLILDKNFYQALNEKYTYNPLSSVFIGKETDHLITKEKPMPGYPDKTTYPGKGVTVHIYQPNAKDFVYTIRQVQGSTSAFATKWDASKYDPHTLKQTAGFHCLELITWSDNIDSGDYIYEIELTDYWGQVFKKRITLTAISM